MRKEFKKYNAIALPHCLNKKGMAVKRYGIKNCRIMPYVL